MYNFNMSIDFIYFDIGGVLVNHNASFKVLAKNSNISEDKLHTLFYSNAEAIDSGSMSWEEFESIFYKNFNTEYKFEPNLVTSFVKNFGEMQKVHELVYKLSKNYNIGLLSNVSLEVFKLMEEMHLLPNIEYATKIISAEIGMIKPYKEIFEYAIEQSNHSPENILFIDDTEVNIEMANNLGWKTILFKTNDIESSINKILTLLQKKS